MVTAFYNSDSGIIDFYAGIDSESGHEYPAIRVARAYTDKNGNDITSTYMPIAGGTMTGALNFANNILNLIGDDCYLGDCDVAGCIEFKGNNGQTGIVFKKYDGTGGDIIFYNNCNGYMILENGNVQFNGSLNVLGGIYANGFLVGDGNSSGVYHTTGTATVNADGTVDTTMYFYVTYVRPPAFSFAINDYSGNFHDYLVFTKEVTTTYAVVRFYRRTGSQAATMTFQWAAVGRYD